MLVGEGGATRRPVGVDQRDAVAAVDGEGAFVVAGTSHGAGRDSFRNRKLGPSHLSPASRLSLVFHAKRDALAANKSLSP